MAIQKEEELDAIFKDENKTQATEETLLDTPPNDVMDESILIDTYNALIHVLNIEISGLKIGVWLLLLVMSIIISSMVWRIINKVKEHNDSKLFEKAKDYMHKAGDLNRRTLPFSMFIILLFLLFIEASGFSYVFGELMIGDASESMLHYAMVFGGFVVSIVLMFLTHFSGEEMHKNSVLKSIDNEMASLAKESVFEDKNNYPRNKTSLELTNNDDGAKTVVIPQFNRLHQKHFDWKNFKTLRTYYTTIFTFIFILSIGIGAMFVRFYVFEKNVDHYQTSIVNKTSSFDIKTELYEEKSKGNTEVKNSTPHIPSYYTQQSELRDKYQRSSKVEAEKKASYITYMVMMMLFFGIQMVGLIVGSRYSFIGEESKKAYKLITSYKESKAWKSY